MSYCQNCGHPQHDGPLYKGPEGQIEVCKNCRCEKCEPSIEEFK